MSVKALLRASLLALALLPAFGALPADADDGRPQSTEAGHPPSPVPVPKSQLGPTAIDIAPIPSVAPESFPTLSHPNGAQAKKELVIFVGGYGSSQQENDTVCADIRTWFDPGRYEIACFGDDPAFPYDTYGSIDAGAGTLIAQIRSRPSEYSSIDIISHSMGGVVVDRAFADGLSAQDGVAVSVAIASPHSGSTFARVGTLALPLVTPVADIIRAEALSHVHSDPSSDAARGLAIAHPVRTPPSVAKLDVGLANDVLVPTNDSRDPGVEQRLYLPEVDVKLLPQLKVDTSQLEGHGGSLKNKELRSVVIEAVQTHRIPPDRRSLVTQMAAPMIAPLAQKTGFALLVGIVAACCAFALVMRLPSCRKSLKSLHARAIAYLHAHGR
jgi:hypothetical protein